MYLHGLDKCVISMCISYFPLSISRRNALQSVGMAPATPSSSDDKEAKPKTEVTEHCEASSDGGLIGPTDRRASRKDIREPVCMSSEE
jgi:hypothetical protein